MQMISVITATTQLPAIMAAASSRAAATAFFMADTVALLTPLAVAAPAFDVARTACTARCGAFAVS